jgi:hypothetical protein
MQKATLELKVEVKIRRAWWVGPYMGLTAFGARLGLPINPEVVAADLMRGIRVETKVRMK